MSYAEKSLKAHGQTCSIARAPVVPSKVSIKRSTKSSRDLGSREAYWEGLILADSNLQSGEVLTIGTDKYLVQSANYDPASGEIVFFSAKCNTVLQHWRYEDTEENGNIIQTWVQKNADVPAYAEVVTYALRQFDPGLLEQTRYIVQAATSINVLLLDRLVFDGDNHQVVSVDSVGMSGVSRLQLGVDTRP